MEYVVTYEKDGITHTAHVTNAANACTASKMVEAYAGAITVVNVSVATITVPVVKF